MQRYKFIQSDKVLLLILVLSFSNIVLGQSNKGLYQISPKWKLGDIKRVHTESISKIFIKDSLLNNTRASAEYGIKVIDTIKNYTLLYFNELSPIKIESTSSIPAMDSAINILKEITKVIEQESASFKYKILVSKKTGLAFEIKNGDELLKNTDSALSILINELGSKRGKTKTQIDTMQQRATSLSKMNHSKILQTVINQINYIMQPYSYRFSYNSTISQKAMISDVNVLSEFGNIEMPATLTISSKETENNTLTVLTDTDYDKAFVLEQIKKKRKSLGDVKPSDIFLSEKVETVFALGNNWIIKHTSNVNFELKDVKVMNQSMISFH